MQLSERDQRRRAAADAVEQRHHLRHRGHLHAARRHRAEAAADHHADHDRPPARRADVDPRDDDREQHADRADLVAAPRARRIGQELQCEDEADDRDQVQQVRDVVAHEGLPSCDASTGFFSGSRFLNISSIRSVTTKPPTTFADARMTAAKPTIQVKALLVRKAEHDHRADDHDPVDRVRARHQRRVQQRRHLRDHLDADEDRQHQDRHLEDQDRSVAHAATSCLPATQAPAVISSDQSRTSSPSGARCSSSAWTLRA